MAITKDSSKSALMLSTDELRLLLRTLVATKEKPSPFIKHTMREYLSIVKIITEIHDMIEDRYRGYE